MSKNTGNNNNNNKLLITKAIQLFIKNEEKHQNHLNISTNSDLVVTIDVFMPSIKQKH